MLRTKKLGIICGVVVAFIIILGCMGNATGNYNWSELPKLPQYEYNLTNPLLLPIGDKIYSFGGIDYNNNRLYIYDINSKTWADKSSSAFEIRNAPTAGEAHGNNAYIIPGYSPDMVIYDTSNDTKTTIPSGFLQTDETMANGGTIFNVLGTSGDCEDISEWKVYNGSAINLSTNNLFGRQSIQINQSAELNGFTKNITSCIDKTKYYFVTGYINTNGIGTDGAKIALIDADDNLIGGTNTYQMPTKWQRVGYKIQPSDFDNKNLNAINFAVLTKDGGKTLITNADGLSLIEISSDDYNKSVDQLMSKYPYRGQNINFLGQIGDCEDIMKWTKLSGNYGLSRDGALFGNRSIYFTYNDSDILGCYTSVADKIDPTKYYFLSGYAVANSSSGNGGRFVLLDGGLNEIGTSPYIIASAYTRMGYKIQPSDFSKMGDPSNIYAAFQSHDPSRTTSARIDGVMLIEITKEEYDSLSEQQLMDRHPYLGIDDTSRYYTSLTAYGDKLYLIGGYYGPTTANDGQTKWGEHIWEFDTIANKWAPTELTLEVAGHMAFNVGGKIYIIGGRDGSGATRNTRVLEWNPQTGEFVMKNNTPVAIDTQSDSRWKGVVVNGKIYIRNLSSTYVYNPSDDTWTWIEMQVPTTTTTNWTAITGSYSITNNTIQMSDASGTDAIYYNEDIDDGQITARVQALNDGTTIYLPFRSSMDGKYKYFIEITSDTLRLCKTSNYRDFSTSEEICSVERSLNISVPNTYNIILNGNNISVWENYKLQIMVNDDSYSRGRMGFASQDTQASISFIHLLKINENTNVKGNELVTNGTIDNNIEGWTVNSADDIIYSNGKLKITEQNLTSSRNAIQSVKIGDAQAIVLKYNANAYNLATNAGLSYTWKTNDAVISTANTGYITKNGHIEVNLILEVPDGATSLELKAFVQGSNPSTGYAEFDNISVKEYAPDYAAIKAGQAYTGITSYDGKIYQFKGNNNMILDATFGSGSLYWTDADAYPKSGYASAFGSYGIALSDDTNFEQNVYVMPNTKYRIAFNEKYGTLLMQSSLPALKISFFDAQGQLIADKDVEILYKSAGSYGNVQSPFFEFTSPVNAAYAKIIPYLLHNTDEIDTTEKWVQNPSFTVNTSSWGWGDSSFPCSEIRDTSNFYSSPASLKLTRTSSLNPSGYEQIYCTNQSISVEKGKWYKISFAANPSTATSLTWMGVYDQVGEISYKNYFTTQTIYPGWRTYDMYFVPNNDYKVRTIYARFSGDFDTLYVDDFSLKEVDDIELLVNKSFDKDIFGWNFYKNTDNGASGIVSRDTYDFDTAPGALKVTCANSGIATSDLRVYSDSLPIERYLWYKLTFRAKSTQGFKLPSVALVKYSNGSSYSYISFNNTPTITTDWETYTVYYMANSTVSDASIRFNLGVALPVGAEFYIDSLSFQQTEDKIDQIKNKGFDANINEWSTILNNGANVTISHDAVEGYTAPGSLKVTCTNHGRENVTDSTKGDDVQVVSSEGLKIYTERVYKVTFKAKSTLQFVIPYVRLQQKGSTINYYSRLSGDLSIGTVWNTYTVYFRSNDTVNDARIVFGLGNEMPNGSILYIDDISFEETPFHWMGDFELYPATDFFECDMSLEAPTNTTVIDNYLEQGGKVLWVGNTPFKNVGTASGTKSEWENDLLESSPVDLNNNQTVSITQSGTSLGLLSTWASKAPMSKDDVNISLASIANGNGAGYEKSWNVVSPDKFVIRDWTVLGALSTDGVDTISEDFVGEDTIQPFTGMMQIKQYNFANKLGNDGNFEVDTDENGLADGWSAVGTLTSTSTVDNEQVFTSTVQNGGITKAGITNLVEDVIYAFGYIDSNSNNVKLQLVSGSNVRNEGVHSSASGYEFVSSYFKTIEDTNITVRVIDERTAGFAPIKVKRIHLLNLTDIFGEGNEPSKSQMDAIVQGMVAKYGYVDEDLAPINLYNKVLMNVNGDKLWNNYDYSIGTGDYIDFKTLYGDGAGKVAYANAYINSNTNQGLILKLNTQNNIKVFINGIQVPVNNYAANIDLVQGLNRILLKSEGSSDNWYVGVELEKPFEINPITDVQGGISIDNQNVWMKDWLVLKGFIPGEDPLNANYIGDEAGIIPKDGMQTAGKTWDSFTADYTGTTAYSYGVDISYAYTTINASEAHRAMFYVQRDNEVKIWVNGVVTASGSVSEFVADLNQGENRILVKVYNSGGPGYFRLMERNYINDWLVLDGITYTGATSDERIENDYIGGESTIEPTEGMVTATKTWTRFTANDTGMVFYDTINSRIGYAYTTIYSDTNRKAMLYESQDDWVKIWVNGEAVSRNSSVPINLVQGDNKILVKLLKYSGTNYFRIWLTTTQTVAEKPNGITVLGNGNIGKLIRLYDTSVDGSNANVQNTLQAVVSKTNDNKVVYYDTTKPFASTLIKNAESFKNYLISKGFIQKNSTELGDWMLSKLVTNSAPGTVVVFAQENVPDTILDTQDSNSLLRRYLNAGGKVVWLGEKPLYNMSSSESRTEIKDYSGEWTSITTGTNTDKWFISGIKPQYAPSKTVGTATIVDDNNVTWQLGTAEDTAANIGKFYFDDSNTIVFVLAKDVAQPVLTSATLNYKVAATNIVLGNGSKNILGIELKDPAVAESLKVTLAEAAKSLGVGSVTNWKSTDAISPGQGETALTVTAAGDVAGWIRNYNPKYPYSGFVRMYDGPITISDTEKNNILKVGLADVNSSTVYYDSRYPSDWITNSFTLKSYLKGKGLTEISAENTDYINSGTFNYKTIAFSQDVIPNTFTRLHEKVTITPTSAIVTWVDNSEGESAFVIYANGIKKKTIYSDTSFGKGKSYVAAVEDLDANTILTVKPVYFHHSENDGQYSEGNGLDFLVETAVSNKPSGLRGKTYAADEELRNTVDISWEDTATTETGFEIYIDGDASQVVESTSVDSIGNTYTVRFDNLESGKTYTFGVKNVYPTQKSAMATVNVQVPPANVGSISVAECESLDDGWAQVGRGYVVLEWDTVQGATSYGIYMFDGADYRKVDEVAEPKWDSRIAKIYPSETELNYYPDNSIPQDQSPFSKVGQGQDLRDVPTRLYQKTWGTDNDARTDYSIKVSVINAAGEIQYPDDKVSFSFNSMSDTIPPYGGIVINDDEGITKNRVVKVSITATDAESGVDTIQFSEDNMNWSPKYSYVASMNWTLSSTIGTKTLYCMVKDKAGNSVTFRNSIELLAADSAPTIRLTINSGNDTVAAASTPPTQVMLNVDVSDDITAATSLSIRFSNNNVTWSDWKLCTTNQFEWNLTNGNGQKTVYAQVKDENGNIGNAMSYITVVSSTATSAVNIIAQSSNKITVDGLTYPAIKTRLFEAGISAPGDTAQISISWDGITWSPWENATITSSGGGLLNIKKKLNFQGSQGWNELYIKLKNSSGVETGMLSQKILIDTKAPTFKLQTMSGSTATSGSQIDLVAEVEDDVSDKFMYSVNGGEKIDLPGDGKITVTGIEKGKLNLINIKIYDQTGNAAQATIRIWGL